MQVPVGDTELEFSLLVRPHGLHALFHILGALRCCAAEGHDGSTQMIAQNSHKDCGVAVTTSAVLKKMARESEWS